MDKESQYLLQCIDCNCNNCIFMQRDSAKRSESLRFHQELQKRAFDIRKAKEIQVAEAMPDPKGRATMLNKAHKLNFQFDTGEVAVHYGTCLKLNKPVSFIPEVCQLETQQCFQHRRKYANG